MRWAFALLGFVLSLVVTGRAAAFTPPTMTGHVTDAASKLTDADRAQINEKLENYPLRTTNEVAVFLPASLDGEAIEDVGIETFRAWKLGVKGKDNGVLLVIAPAERKARIEVGKGVEGALTDLQSNDIIRQKLRPTLMPGHENYLAAVLVGTDAIMSALDAGGAGGGVAKPTHPPASSSSTAIGLIFLLLVFLVPIILFITIIRAIAGAFSSNGRYANRGWASGGTWSNDSSWSSGSNDTGWSGGGGGGGGGDFTGGGGDAGGGGSSDSF